MANLFQTGMTWLAGQLTAHMSVSVSYLPKAGGAAIVMDAVPGRPQAIGVDPEQGQTKGRVRLDDEWVRFHFQPGLLTAGDPARGDRLTVGGFVREVASLNGQPCWGRSEVLGDMVWVDTRRVG